MPPRPSADSIVYPPNASPRPGATRSVTARPQAIAEAALVLDQVPGAERLELLAQFPDELRELLPRVHGLVPPDRKHQLVVRAERRRALGHVPDEEVRLRADRDLVPLAAPHEDEPRFRGVVAETAFGSQRSRARRLRVLLGMERELEEAANPARLDRREHAHDVAVAEGCPAVDTLQLVPAPQEGAVDAAAVDDEPEPTLALERAMARAGDDAILVGLQADVVQVREAADARARAGQDDGLPRVPLWPGDNDLR